MPDDNNSNKPKENVEVLKDGATVPPKDFKEAFIGEDGKPILSEDGKPATTATLLSNESIDEIIKKDIFPEAEENEELP